MAIALRPLREDDWQAVHEWARLPEVSRYQTWGPNSVEDTQAYVAAALAATADPSNGYVWVAQRPDGRVVGNIELHLHAAQDACGEVGYLMHPEVWGRGHATAAAARVVEFAFTELGLHRVQATCHPDNRASARVLDKLGMTREGRLRENLRMRDGSWRDSEMFAVLAREWRRPDALVPLTV